MKTPLIAAAVASFIGTSLSPANAGEHITLTVQSQAAQSVSSEIITLNQGDTAELVYCSYSVDDTLGASFVSLAGTVNNKPFAVPTARVIARNNVGNAWDLNRVKIAGPAALRLQIGATTPQRTEFATIEVNRAGTASAPAGIPEEANSTWQVNLEASSDLVLWTPVPAGSYPGNTPQRFFRVRIVKQP